MTPLNSHVNISVNHQQLSNQQHCTVRVTVRNIDANLSFGNVRSLTVDRGLSTQPTRRHMQRWRVEDVPTWMAMTGSNVELSVAGSMMTLARPS